MKIEKIITDYHQHIVVDKYSINIFENKAIQQSQELNNLLDSKYENRTI